MNENVQQFLDSIQDLKSKKFKVPQISAGKDILCKPLTFKQQKDLISTIADGTVGVLKFQKNINDIIMENLEKDDVLMGDKIPIILNIRANSIGTKIKIDDDIADISSSVDKSNYLKFPTPPSIDGEIIVKLGIPTLKEENKIITYSIELMKKSGGNDTGKNIGNIYTFEIIKFIESVKFGDNELVFSEIPVKDRVTIVDNLPLTVNKKIIKYIESFKEVENDILKVDVGGEQKSFDIDVSFFDS